MHATLQFGIAISEKRSIPKKKIKRVFLVPIYRLKEQTQDFF